MAIETFQRQEIKFLLNEVQYQALTEQLEQYMNPDPYCVGGKDYGIYNIYYDTPDDYLIRTSLAKPYYKEKIRLRSYMSPAKPEDLVFLEIKKKIGGNYAHIKRSGSVFATWHSSGGQWEICPAAGAGGA